MFDRLAAKFSRSSSEGVRPARVSILIPLLIISLGLGVLALRSYQLSVRMEEGANMLAVQYAGYAAEITARRIDAAVRTDLSRADEEWQQLERRNADPDAAALRDWMTHHEWIVSAIYVPDHDPASSIFASEPGASDRSASRLSREIFTSSGMVRYTYDPARLLARARGAVQQPPIIGTRSKGTPVRADVTVVKGTSQQGMIRQADGFAFISPLGEPMQGYSVRATVPTSFAGTGWENQRLVSLGASLLALSLLAFGTYLAVRGLNKEAETMKLRASLIANVSHELRTPLAMIRLGAETLKRGARLRPGERNDIEETILREVLHLSHLVENVLDVARMQNADSRALAFTPVNPRELVAALLASYESWIRSKRFEVELRVDDAVEAQMWDRDAVSRAVLNLIDNAIKYSGDEKRELVVTVAQTEEYVTISVRDHGLGIGPKDLSRIFDPYYRARFSDTQTRRGAGLGLTLVQHIAAAHGGRVEVESQPGEGSTFRLLFPRTPQAEGLSPGMIRQSKPLTL